MGLTKIEDTENLGKLEFKDKKDTFGGTSERKLPFEVKKESVMSMQNWVKIDQVEQPATSGWETGILNNYTV